MKWISKDTRLFFEHTLGKRSHLTKLGKFVLSPFILIAGCVFGFIELLFTKKGE
ncbi:MAG: hypothetical protein GY714_19900 [Desulfobacterales bacterium]|nr:hypothetical protein [Desulfobacterales bacterium]